MTLNIFKLVFVKDESYLNLLFQYWVERAESMFPANEVIFNLKVS